MTPEARAADIMVAWGWGLPGPEPLRLNELREFIAGAIGAAVAEEREACAKLAEDGLAPESNYAPFTPGFVRRNVAGQIRART